GCQRWFPRGGRARLRPAYERAGCASQPGHRRPAHVPRLGTLAPAGPCRMAAHPLQRRPDAAGPPPPRGLAVAPGLDRSDPSGRAVRLLRQVLADRQLAAGLQPRPALRSPRRRAPALVALPARVLTGHGMRWRPCAAIAVASWPG